MNTYIIYRTLLRSQVQAVEAENEAEALEIADENPENWEDTVSNEEEWQYKVEKE